MMRATKFNKTRKKNKRGRKIMVPNPSVKYKRFEVPNYQNRT